jgi:hypothetical protein
MSLITIKKCRMKIVFTNDPVKNILQTLSLALMILSFFDLLNSNKIYNYTPDIKVNLSNKNIIFGSSLFDYKKRISI